ncbi:MAG: MerR family transcriptional regulator [Gammaproteobacteria bacterium]|nr:MerR family transcriptional regulator [Gammaproteobacteria bacterium]
MPEFFDPASARRQAKSAAAFRTISEVASELAVPQHVLRFWESKFSQIRPLKRGGGRRYYRPEDVTLLRRIRQCLYEDGYTIKGVQRLLREGQLKPPEQPEPMAIEEEPPALQTLPLPLVANDRTDVKSVLREIRKELADLRELLRKVRPS